MFVQVAKDLGPGHTVVTALCDTGEVSLFCKCICTLLLILYTS